MARTRFEGGESGKHNSDPGVYTGLHSAASHRKHSQAMAQKIRALFSLIGLDVQRKVVQGRVVAPPLFPLYPQPLPCKELFRKPRPGTSFSSPLARTMAHSHHQLEKLGNRMV